MQWLNNNSCTFENLLGINLKKFKEQEFFNLYYYYCSELRNNYLANLAVDLSEVFIDQ